LKGIQKLIVKPGDRVRIETPGGGAWLQEPKSPL
jgi:N-methylhydantoinase B/oxoprolinase/acetone carboxylase alpha subunit